MSCQKPRAYSPVVEWEGQPHRFQIWRAYLCPAQEFKHRRGVYYTSSSDDNVPLWRSWNHVLFLSILIWKWAVIYGGWRLKTKSRPCVIRCVVPEITRPYATQDVLEECVPTFLVSGWTGEISMAKVIPWVNKLIISVYLDNLLAHKKETKAITSSCFFLYRSDFPSAPFQWHKSR